MSHRRARRTHASGYGPLSPGPLMAVLVAVVAALAASSALGYGEGVQSDEGTKHARDAALGHHSSRASLPVDVFIDARRLGRLVPRRFLGLSFEVSSLRQIGHYGGSGNLVRLLRSLGPGVLRFGGASADTRVAWTAPARPPPAWASGSLGVADLRAVARLASSSGWSVLLTIGLGHFDPSAAAGEAAGARGALGKSLAGTGGGKEGGEVGAPGP